MPGGMGVITHLGFPKLGWNMVITDSHTAAAAAVHNVSMSEDTNGS
jgi:hypothetical protein